jgi:hypothetical protein
MGVVHQALMLMHVVAVFILATNPVSLHPAGTLLDHVEYDPQSAADGAGSRAGISRIHTASMDANLRDPKLG